MVRWKSTMHSPCVRGDGICSEVMLRWGFFSVSETAYRDIKRFCDGTTSFTSAETKLQYVKVTRYSLSLRRIEKDYRLHKPRLDGNQTRKSNEPCFYEQGRVRLVLFTSVLVFILFDCPFQHYTLRNRIQTFMFTFFFPSWFLRPFLRFPLFRCVLASL